MALSLEESRYPLSAADGTVIHLDVMGPISYNIQAITTAALGAVIPLSDYESTLLEVHSDVDCIIGFSGIPIDLSINLGEYILQAGETRTLLPLSNTLSAVALTASGTLYVNSIRKWNTLAIKTDEG